METPRTPAIDSAALLELPSDMILRVEVGSTAHGTAIDGQDDFDEGCIVIETPEQVFTTLGLKTKMQRTQPEGSRSGPGDVDRTVYPLRKWVSLAKTGNPSILQMLWCPVLTTTESGQALIAVRDQFVGPHIIPRYRGYLRSQVERIVGARGSGHGRRGSGGREELIEVHGYDTKLAMHAARLGFQCLELLDTGGLVLPMEGESGDVCRAIRRGETSFDEWWELVLELDNQIAIIEKGRFPGRPETAEIDALLTEIHFAQWNVQ